MVHLEISDFKIPASARLNTFAAMLNGILKLPITTCAMQPYMGLGMGYVHENFKLNIEPIPTQDGVYVFDTIKSIDSNLGFQGITGVSYAFTPKTSLNIEYRYLNAFRINTSNHTLDLKLLTFF